LPLLLFSLGGKRFAGQCGEGNSFAIRFLRYLVLDSYKNSRVQLVEVVGEH
jgi:hypothetical protein